ncbi:MAG: Bcr/CflA family drug resistance efflux transporter [Rubrivivax sp. SCN 71-131]|nr:MAG: Bcr/CflA family drug resistance efflux transporter [Rubrivivax sp. SCN 71-131]
MSTSASSSATAPARPGKARVALALSLLLGLQPVTTDLYLPALPQLTQALGASMTMAQQTLAALLLAFGLAQLAWGPVADRVGRRPVLLWGLSMYALASLACALAPSVELLVLARFVQGLGMGAAVVCARALVRDLYDPLEGARVMAWGMTGLGVLAISSPLIGGAVTALAGWRVALAVVALVGAAVLAFIFWRMPETAPLLRPDATRPGVLLANLRRIAGHRVFIAWALLTSSSYAGLFTMLASSSFVFIDVLGVSPTAYGLLLGSYSIAYIAGTFVCRRWVLRFGPIGAVQRAAMLTLAGGASMAGLTLLGVQSVWAIALPQLLFAVGHGVHQPVSQTAAVGPFPDQAGTASALAGFMVAALAYASGLWLGVALDGTVRPLTYGVGFWSLVISTAAWTLVRRLQRT